MKDLLIGGLAGLALAIVTFGNAALGVTGLAG